MNQPLSFAVVTQGLASRMPELNNIRPTLYLKAELVKETVKQLIFKNDQFGEIRFNKNFDGQLDEQHLKHEKVLGVEHGFKDYHGEPVPRQLVCIESAKIEQSQFYLKVIKFKSDVAKGKISLDDYETLFSAINYEVEAE